MPLPNEIQLAPLDFDTVKNNLKLFLKNQTTLQDYNFEGSTISVLLDILAFDAYYHGWYTNFAVNEVFLQTAQLRNSVVSAARQIGYIPRSVSSSIALTDITVANVTLSSSVTIPRYEPFTTTVNGNTFHFYTVTDTTILKDAANSTAFFPGVELYEGVKLQQNFTVSANADSGASFTILNQNVDTRTISVTVKLSANSPVTHEYTKATSALGVNATSNVYFLFEDNNGTWELQFGDGVLGRALTAGQVVIVDYLYSRGSEPNGANTFLYAGSTIAGSSNVSVTLTDADVVSSCGSAREDIASIKRNAPAIYQSQGRIVTTYDCRSILLSEVGGIDSIAVWGGEDNDPPKYGTMFMSVKPANAEKLSDTQKSLIMTRVIKPRALPIVNFEFVDPDFVYVVTDTTVRYSPALTGLTSEEVRQKVVDAVSSYATNELGQFGSYLRYSQLVAQIDDADPSVVSNVTTLRLEKRMTVNTSVTSYTLKFSNELYYPSSDLPFPIVTTRVGAQYFSYVGVDGNTYTNCFVEDDNTILHVYRLNANGDKELVKSSVGSVDVTTGEVTLTGFSPTSITTTPANRLKWRAIPARSEIEPTREQIILLPTENINVGIVSDLINRSSTSHDRQTAGGQRASGGYVINL